MNEARGSLMSRDMNPGNNANWKLVCSYCGSELAVTETVDLVDGHHQKEHPDQDPTPSFNIIWVGIGRKPKGGRR